MDSHLGRLRALSAQHTRAESVQKMAGSITSVIGDSDDFLSALGSDGVLSLLISTPGEFCARLTQINLHDVRLSIGDERLSRISLVAAPAGKFLTAMSFVGHRPPTWGGVELRVDELITLGPGQRVHMRTDGPCKWAVLQISIEGLNEYGSALLGRSFAVPPLARWRPPRAALNLLRGLQQAALSRVKCRSAELAGREAAHGLEQQLIHALIECLSAGPIDEMQASRRREEILADFETCLEAEPSLTVGQYVVVSGTSRRILQESCERHLGMSPGRYLRLWRAARAGTKGRAYWEKWGDLA